MRTSFLSALAILTVPVISAGASADSDGGASWSFERYLSDSYAWGDVVISAGPDSIRVDWDGLGLGPALSTDVRKLADGALSGDRDGRVDAKERDDFELALRALLEREFAKFANHRPLSDLVLIDQAEAAGAEVTRLEATGLEGDVERSEAITLSFGVAIEFPNVDEAKDLHTVRLDIGPHYLQKGHEGDAARAVRDLTLTVTGQPGWSIDPASVQPDCASAKLEEGRMAFTGEDAGCFTGHTGVLLAFTITGKGERDAHFLPGFETLVAGAALAGAVALRRRRA